MLHQSTRIYILPAAQSTDTSEKKVVWITFFCLSLINVAKIQSQAGVA
jgi:hypothetical protein